MKNYTFPLIVHKCALGVTLLILQLSAFGSNTWTGEGTTNLWSTAANWSDGIPVDGQDVTINSGSLILTEATAELASFTLAEGATLTVEGWESTIQGDEIEVAGTITHAAQTVTEPDPITGEWVPQHRVWLQGSNLIVATTGQIDADDKGYMPGAGPGRSPSGVAGAGGGYGGHGGDAYQGAKHGPAYGDPADPWQPGSGGQAYNAVYDRAAGGSIRIEMSGNAAINGLISACGNHVSHDIVTAANFASCGSGGGIAIICDTFQGAATGLIRADGGRARTHGGNSGGGRIALHYNPTAQAGLANPRPPVRISTLAWESGTGGVGFTVKAQMGTLYLPDLTLLADSPTAAVALTDHRFWYTRLVVGSDFTHWAPESLVISNCVVGLPMGFSLEVGEDLTLIGTQAPLAGATTVRAGLTMYAAATNELYGARLTVGRDLIIGNKAWIFPHTQGYSAAIVGMRAGRHVTVANDGGIDANDKGYMPQFDNANGPGVEYSGWGTWSGGGYGGAGGGQSLGGQTYGDAALPLDPGSPGSWLPSYSFTPTGKGGGVIHLLAGGTLVLDGLLTANGGVGWYAGGPGGSGGSIFVSGKQVSGQGHLQANGGAGNSSSYRPGGGGRIAVWHGLPLSVVQERIAITNTASLVHTPTYKSFEGEMQAGATDRTGLAYHPEEGTTGFYSIGGTVLSIQ